jgi:hypothetical protein
VLVVCIRWIAFSSLTNESIVGGSVPPTTARPSTAATIR